MSDIVKVEKPFRGVIHVVYPNQTMLAKAFMRMQEFYESHLDDFKGRHFTRDEFKKAYAEFRGTGTGYGEFTYYDDWGGFNVPGDVANRFMRLFKPDFMEETLVRLIKKNRKPRGEYYVIGTHAKDPSATVDHELSHAFWHLHPEYREEQQSLVDGLPRRFYKQAKRALNSMGYCDEVIDDEITAYLSTGTLHETVDVMQTEQIPWKYMLEFQKIFVEHYKHEQE